MTDMKIQKHLEVQVAKVDDELGVVLGYAIVCKQGGEPYYDSHGDYFPEEEMLKSCTAFMEGSRVAKMQHEGESVGTIVFGFPMTEDIAKSLGFGEIDKSGFIIGMKPDDATLQKFKSGELTGFSMGGTGKRIKE